MKYLSTSALAKSREIESKQLFDILRSKGWVYKKDDQWQLTKDGRIAGGDTKYNPKFGDYVVWPFNLDIEQQIDSKQLLSATKIGEAFNISNRKVNLYLSDSGWISKERDGWILTSTGKRNGGHQMEFKNGVPYAIWHPNILTNKHLIRTINIGEGKIDDDLKEDTDQKTIDFRKKFPAEIRTSDGHYVRSRGEQLIDNFFYRNGIVHAVERKLNIDEPLYCDFYLPQKNVYVEYWGLDNDKDYLERKKRKLELYAQNGYDLIELNNSDLVNLDESLEAKLRKKGIIIK